MSDSDSGTESDTRPEPEVRPEPKNPLRGSRTSGLWAAVVASALVLILLIVFIAQNTEPVDVRFLGVGGADPARGGAADRQRRGAAARGGRRHAAHLAAAPAGPPRPSLRGRRQAGAPELSHLVNSRRPFSQSVTGCEPSARSRIRIPIRTCAGRLKQPRRASNTTTSRRHR